MKAVADLHLEHARQIFFAERNRREAIRGSLSTPVAAISFAVFALSTLTVEIDLARWEQPSTIAIMVLVVCSVGALFASAYHVVMAEWLFIYHEPPRLPDLVAMTESSAEAAGVEARNVLGASYAIAYEEQLKGNAISAIRRTWSLRLILLALALQAMAFLILPFHRGGF